MKLGFSAVLAGFVIAAAVLGAAALFRAPPSPALVTAREQPLRPRQPPQTPDNPALGAASETAARIRQAQARLDELLRHFTDSHPDVIETRKNIEELKRRYLEELEASKHPPAVPAPPEPHLLPIPPFFPRDLAAPHPMPAPLFRDDGPATKATSNR